MLFREQKVLVFCNSIMKIYYVYHSCFVATCADFACIIDYYKDSGGTYDSGIVHDDILRRSGRLYVLSSHIHPDHFNPEILKWREINPNIRYIFSSDILDGNRVFPSDAVFLKKSDSFKDDLLNIQAFGSTDAGISFSIEGGGKKLFHAGDLNNWHWNEESSPEYADEAENFFLRELDDLARKEDFFDAVMFPVDKRLGKDYMTGAQQFVRRIKTNLFLPMHFGKNYDAANAFEKYAESEGCGFGKITHKGQEFSL